MSILITMVSLWVICFGVFIFRRRFYTLFSKPEHLILGEKITKLRLLMLSKPIAERFEDLKEISVLEERYAFLVAKKTPPRLVSVVTKESLGVRSSNVVSLQRGKFPPRKKL